MLVGCSGAAKYPEGSESVQCTNLVDDCDQQAAEECPGGYEVLHKDNWTSNLGGIGRGAARSSPVRHTSIRIACKPVSEATDSSWCAFPSEAEAAPFDEADATMSVELDAAGRPYHVTIVEDPGFGLGEAAARCALRKTFAPQRDTAGRAVAGSFKRRVHFVRPAGKPAKSSD